MNTLKSIPNLVKGAIAFVTLIIVFIGLIRDNLYLSVIIILACLLVAIIGYCVIVIASKEESKIYAGKKFRYPKKNRILFTIVLVLLIIFSILLFIPQKNRDFVWIAFNGTLTPTPTSTPPRTPTPTSTSIPTSTPTITSTPEPRILELGKNIFLTFTSGEQERGLQTIVISELEPGWYSFEFESFNPPNSGYFIVWDYVALMDGRDIIWEIGQKEAPADFSPSAYQEFCDPNEQIGCEFEYVVQSNEARDFPKEINDGDYPSVTVSFFLTEEESENDLMLILSTLYSTHTEADHFDMKVSLMETNQP
ncbi:hypothetical protein [Candidatus Leptofilum sp.]|uniref:hypothetical protein n=1 Tax=Candidatus Leptofilum sp. TaxID=3241576 RepID=UPI003B5CFF15